MKNSILLLALSLVLYSCSSTRLMSLSVLEPAPVTLPPTIKKAAIVNRSLSSNNGRILDAVDKIVTLEGARLDKDGSEASIESLQNELLASKRFDDVKKLEYDGPGNNTPGMYPAPLSWSKVEEICKQNKTDVLFSLELFDTDSKINYAAIPTRVNTPLGSIPAIHQEATLRTLVKTGWRIYDPASKLILDEAALSRHIVFTGRGINPVMAANALIGRKDAVKQVGSRAGAAYAYRVLPAWIRVSRLYYVRANRMFKVARRKAEGRNWDGAAEIWQDETSSPKRKVAGRACYNMAIISEINGNLDEAVRWAQAAYEDHNIRLALRYIRILEDRKFRNRILEEQQVEEVADRK
jgi:hypothetical protein